MRYPLAILAPLALLAAGTACADDAQDKYFLGTNAYFGILPGYAFPAKAMGTSGTGFTGSGIFGYQFARNFSVEVNAQTSTFGTGGGKGTDFYQHGGTVDLVGSLFDRRTSKLTPYMLIGVGGVYNDLSPDDRDGGNFIANAGIGVVSGGLFGSNVRFRAEGRYVFDRKESNYNEYRALAGLEFQIGKASDHQLAEAAPAQPQVVEVVKEVERVVPDSDGDTVDDEKDKCPDTPKGFKVDADGCIIANQTIDLHGVTFEFNKSRLTPNAQTVLDLIAPAFSGQPTLKAEIDGHTDMVGSGPYNLKLSQRRADSVRQYLIGKGAKPEQLTAVGYGKSQPRITPEKTPDDAELNRRVEFRVLAK